MPRNVPSSCVRGVNGPGLVSLVNSIIAGTSAAPSVTISVDLIEVSTGAPIICSPGAARRILNSAGAVTGSMVNSTAWSDRDISSPSAVKLGGDMSAIAANGAIAGG